MRTIPGAGAFALAAMTLFVPATGFAADPGKAVACMSGASAVRVYSVVEQDRIEAQYNGVGATPGQIPTRSMLPPNTPILEGAVGGAIAGLIIEKSAEASNRHFAEDHLKPLQDATRSIDLRGELQAAAQNGATTLAWVAPAYTVVNGKFDPASVPADATAWIVLKNHYALSPDFAALIVRSDLEFYRRQAGDNGERWRSHPCYEATLVYQSKAMDIPAKTDADRARLVAEENAHWDQAAINRDIKTVNDAGFTSDPTIRTLRRTVADRLQQHKQ